MICKQCYTDKELNESNFYKSTSKFGWDKTCKVCRAENVKNKPKNKNNKKSKFQKDRHGYINPTTPIPIKKFGEDGYGGKWNFDITKLTNDQLTFAKQNGLINHMSKSRTPCYQVKQVNLLNMQLFCDFINLDRKAIITFEHDKPVYVVNLYHQDIVRMLK